MKLYRSDNVHQFCDRTRPRLLQDEAQHHLLLSLQQTLAQSSVSDPPYLAWVEGRAVLGVVVHMAERNIVLSTMSSSAVIQLFVHDLLQTGRQLPGVAGPPTEAQAFVSTWEKLTHGTAKLAMNLQIHQLTQVQPVATAEGYLRRAEQCDRALILEWSQAFDREVFGTVQAWTEQVVERQLRRGRIYLWQDGQPVSMATGRGSNPGNGHIGPVYTPPGYRSQGYATACVAALSQQLLDQGCPSCFLFTDRDNATSNHIYRTIGYQHRCDWLDYCFINPDDDTQSELE